MDALYRHLSDIYGEEVRPTASLFDGLQNADFFMTVSGLVKEVATLLSKITRDLRLMSSGPRSGFMEVRLPPCVSEAPSCRARSTRRFPRW